MSKHGPPFHFETDLLPGEEFREVVGFPNYMVSNMGRMISNARTEEWRILEGHRGKCRGKFKYIHIVLIGRGTRKQSRVHWEVARAFFGPRPSGMFVCHKNDIGWDNRLSNLKYDTPMGNALDAIHNGGKRGRPPGSTTTREKTANRKQRRILKDYLCDILSERVKRKELTLAQAGEMVGLSESAMCRRVKRNRGFGSDYK